MSQRGIFAFIWRNFRQSFSKAKTSGNLVGKDYLGTSYYEIPADPQGGKRFPRRWFIPIRVTDFDQELPPEWQAWLRRRRDEPPTEEEISINMALAATKKQKAKELEEKEQANRIIPAGKSDDPQPSKKPFPLYDEYEIIPGKDGKDTR